jgi:acetyl esterase/lipase
MDHHMKLAALLFMAVLTAPTRAIEATTKFDLWPGNPPGFQVIGGPERDTSTPGKGETGGHPVIRLGFVSKPGISVFLPPKEKRNGTTLIVCPGGGFNILAWDLEGTEVAEWLNSIGVTAVVLKYRVPTASLKEQKWEPPVQDAQRAVSLVRSKAAEWGINPEHIGVLGFSAGGTTAALTAVKNGTRLYNPEDEVDKQACNANFAVLIYPYILYDDKKSTLSENVEVKKETPPMFFAHAANDPINCENSIQMFLALKKAGVKGSEMHIYESGGHGFGMRDTGNPCTTWPKRCEDWMRMRGYLKQP